MADTPFTVAYFCPQCGGASLDFSEIEGGDATCRSCTWKGAGRERVAYPFKHDFISDESMLLSMMQDMRVIFAASSKMYAEFFMKWGFLKVGPGTAQHLARFMAGAARAVLTAIIEERERIEKEEHG
jgi:hypothetical protein